MIIPKIKNRVAHYFVTGILIFFTTFLFGQDKQIYSGKISRKNAGSILSQRVHQLIGKYQRSQGVTETALLSDLERGLYFDPDDYIHTRQTDFVLELLVETMEIESALVDYGLRITGSSPAHLVIEGYCPIEKIQGLEQFSSLGLKYVNLVHRPVLDGGSTTSQADTVLEAYRVRNLSPDNFDGTGVSIGVLSDSYNSLGGASAGMSSGDLPSVTVLEEGGTSDEGRAMVELIYDLAPGATYFFATANGGQTNYANNIQDLADNGCSVIVDDVVYLAEPFFQDGILAQKVDEVTADEDVIYFSSAGNRSTEAYETTTINFVPDATFISTNAFDFDPSGSVDLFQQFTLLDGQEINLSFQWDQPWFSAVTNDLDIIVAEDGTNMVLDASTSDNVLSDQPIELVSYTNSTGSTQIVNFYIYLFSGPTPGRLKYVSFGDVVADEYHTNSPTINPHAAASSGVAVAASAFVEKSVNSFSSIGPSTFLFDADGTPKGSPETRNTPDITATDAANTTFFGSDTGCDFDNFPNFSGTSAAAPHAAAVAALVRQSNPGFSSADVKNAIINSASSLGGASTSEGAGLINAFRSVYPTVTASSINGTEDFEDNTLGPYWETFSNGRGRIRVSTENGPFAGTSHLTMDVWCSTASPDNLNEAILHFDATNLNSLDLTFYQREFGDEDDAMSATFSGSENSDGVAFSVDGTNWYRVVSLTGGVSSSTYNNQTFDLFNLASSNGLTLTADTQIKFQQVDNFPFQDDGMVFDNIQLTGVLLSVEDLTLKGDWRPEGSSLEWSTSTELNNAGYELERSVDGIVYRTIYSLPGAGTSTEANSYSFLDRQAPSGVSYYRVKAIDFDGEIAFSNTIALESADTEPSFSVIPNPVSQRALKLQTSFQEPVQLSLRLFDIMGRQVLQWEQMVDAGTQVLSRNLDDVVSGIYILKVSNGTTIFAETVLVP